MSLSFRAKLMIIVASAAISLAGLILANAVMGARVERQLSAIQATYVPKSELGPKLDAQYTALRQGLQDAVGARDLDSLEKTGDLRDTLVKSLDDARGVVDPDDASSLRTAIGDYYRAAHDVSARLIANESGEGIVDAIAAMQAKQSEAAEKVARVSAFDHGELARAFASIHGAQSAASKITLFASVACLCTVLALSAWLSRDLLTSVKNLGAGFARFGRGEFGAPILVSTQDELGGVAKAANDMAASLERLGADLRANNEDLRLTVVQLEERGAQLEETNHELDSFAYSVSHDLRAPLRAIDGFSRMLIEDYAPQLDDEGKRVVGIVCKNTQKMGRLIDDLLNFSRLGRQSVVSAKVDMDVLFRSVLEDVLAAAPDRKIDLHVGELPPCFGDQSLLRQLWTNLLSNAVKYTRPRPIARIDVTFTVEAEEIVYSVKDNGVGFDDRYANKLFGVFQRLHTTSEFEGTGVGLAIVQRVARRHGGWARAESKLGEGATFTFALPRKEKSDGS